MKPVINQGGLKIRSAQKSQAMLLLRSPRRVRGSRLFKITRFPTYQSTRRKDNIPEFLRRDGQPAGHGVCSQLSMSLRKRRAADRINRGQTTAQNSESFATFLSITTRKKFVDL